MFLLLIVCIVKLIEMLSNNNKLTRNKCLRNATKENHGISETVDENSNKFTMNYFYDIDQSCADQLKEFLKRKAGKDYFCDYLYYRLQTAFDNI